MGMAMVEEMNGAAVRGGFSSDELMVERFAPRRIYALLSRLIGARTIHIPVRQLNVGYPCQVWMEHYHPHLHGIG